MMTAQDNTGPRVALVTGAGRRLGRAIALGMAQAGWDVAVHYRASASEAAAVAADIIALGRRAVALQCDLADQAALQGVVDGLARHVDALVAVFVPVEHGAGVVPALAVSTGDAQRQIGLTAELIRQSRFPLSRLNVLQRAAQAKG